MLIAIMKGVLDFETDYNLKNDRVLLRPIQLADYDNLINFS